MKSIRKTWKLTTRTIEAIRPKSQNVSTQESHIGPSFVAITLICSLSLRSFSVARAFVYKGAAADDDADHLVRVELCIVALVGDHRRVRELGDADVDGDGRAAVAARLPCRDLEDGALDAELKRQADVRERVVASEGAEQARLRLVVLEGVDRVLHREVVKMHRGQHREGRGEELEIERFGVGEVLDGARVQVRVRRVERVADGHRVGRHLAHEGESSSQPASAGDRTTQSSATCVVLVGVSKVSLLYRSD